MDDDMVAIGACGDIMNWCMNNITLNSERLTSTPTTTRTLSYHHHRYDTHHAHHHRHHHHRSATATRLLQLLLWTIIAACTLHHHNRVTASIPGVPFDPESAGNFYAPWSQLPSREQAIMTWWKGPTAYMYSYQWHKVITITNLSTIAPGCPFQVVNAAQQWGNGVLYMIVNNIDAAPGVIDGQYGRFGQSLDKWERSDFKAIGGGWNGIPNYLFDAWFEILDTSHSYYVVNNSVYLYDDAPDRATANNPQTINQTFPGMPMGPWQAAERAPATSSGFVYVTKPGINLYWLWDTLGKVPVPGWPQPFLPVADDTCEVLQERSSLVGIIQDKEIGTSSPYKPNLNCEWLLVAPMLLTHPSPPSIFDREYYQYSYNGMRLDFLHFNLSSNPSDRIEVWGAFSVQFYLLASNRTLLTIFDAANPPPIYSNDGGIAPAALAVNSTYPVLHIIFKTFTRTSSTLGNGWSLMYSMLPSAQPNVTDIRRSQTLLSLPRTASSVLSVNYTQKLRFTALTQTTAVVQSCWGFVAMDLTQLNDPAAPFPGDLTTAKRVKFNAYQKAVGADDSTAVLAMTITGMRDGITDCYLFSTGSVILELDAPADVWVFGFSRSFTQSTCAGTQTYNNVLDGWLDDGSADQDYVRNQVCQWILTSNDTDALFVSFTIQNLDLQITDTPDELSFFDGASGATTALTDTLGSQAVYKASTTIKRHILSDTSSMLVKLDAHQGDGQLERRGGFNGTYTIVFAPSMNHTTFVGLDAWNTNAINITSAYNVTTTNIGINGTYTYNITTMTSVMTIYPPILQPIAPVDASTSWSVRDFGANSSYWPLLTCTVGAPTTMNVTAIDKLGRNITDDNWSADHFIFYIRFVSVGSAPVDRYHELITNKTMDTSLLSEWGARYEQTANTEWSSTISFITPKTSGEYLMSVICVITDSNAVATSVTALLVQNAVWRVIVTPISLPLPNGAHSTIESLPSQIVAGTPTTFYVTMRDMYDNNVERGGYPNNTVRVFAQATTSSAFPKMNVQDLSDGRQEISFSPTKADEYRMTILVAGHDVAASPLGLTVVPNPQPSAVTSSLVLVNAGLPNDMASSLVINLADTYGNPLLPSSITTADAIGINVTIGTRFTTQSSVTQDPDSVDIYPFRDFTLTPSPNTSQLILNFTLSTATLVRVRVRINGVQVQGSPFAVAVGVVVPIEYTQPAGVAIGLVLVSIVMIIVQLVLAVGVYRLRDHMVIKSASPLFCFFILVGAMAEYAVVIIRSHYSPNDSTCMAAPWIGHIAFAVIFGSLFAKTWRLQKIFHPRALNVVKISVSSLVKRVVMLIGVVAAYLAVWSGTSPPTPQMIFVTTSDGFTKIYWTCQSSNSLWPNMILAIEGCSLLYGVWLCIKTRHLPTVFNESKFIALSLYLISFLGGLTILISLLLLSTPDSQMLFECIGILVVTTCVTLLLFVPKLAQAADSSMAQQASRIWDQDSERRMRKRTIHTNPSLQSAGRNPNMTRLSQAGADGMLDEKPMKKGPSARALSNAGNKVGQGTTGSGGTSGRATVAGAPGSGGHNRQESTQTTDMATQLFNARQALLRLRQQMQRAGVPAAALPTIPNAGGANHYANNNNHHHHNNHNNGRDNYMNNPNMTRLDGYGANGSPIGPNGDNGQMNGHGVVSEIGAGEEQQTPIAMNGTHNNHGQAQNHQHVRVDPLPASHLESHISTLGNDVGGNGGPGGPRVMGTPMASNGLPAQQPPPVALISSP